ncbi:helix-turn-helix domain-containing protein [Staphylococcus pseudintermedius]|uniref:helix-turn-helix domain-containing protein n=1 Tax=Staphylococcus pseudintermedius TaxID=283734 RepID=UPI0013694C28|nr:helix-turn-helix transcriptional regulator [Staphylococcus pseudintermedius]MZP63641.1 helix-turn-helix domain-containing protein [Staphylococcus pseudintermedius]
MIRNRLAELLFERDIKIVRISKETGISRNTITNTASNNSEMLQMNTINKICRYLDITPCEFFDYIPIDIDVTFYEDDKIDIVDDWSLDSGEYRIKFDVDVLCPYLRDSTRWCILHVFNIEAVLSSMLIVLSDDFVFGSCITSL